MAEASGVRRVRSVRAQIWGRLPPRSHLERIGRSMSEQRRWILEKRPSGWFVLERLGRTIYAECVEAIALEDHDREIAELRDDMHRFACRAMEAEARLAAITEAARALVLAADRWVSETGSGQHTNSASR